jgi:hypothetical protein
LSTGFNASSVIPQTPPGVIQVLPGFRQFSGCRGQRGLFVRRENSCRFGRRVYIGQLALQHQTPVAIAVQRIEQRLDLHLRVLHHLQVRLDLRRKLSAEAHLVRFEFLLVLHESVLGRGQLRVEELVRTIG